MLDPFTKVYVVPPEFINAEQKEGVNVNVNTTCEIEDIVAVYNNRCVYPVMEIHPDCSPYTRYIPEQHLNVNNSIIHPLQPLLGSLHHEISVSQQPCQLTDISHCSLSLSTLKSKRRKLVPLPTLYTDLYMQINFPSWLNGGTMLAPALCLLCGKVISAGNHLSPNRHEAPFLPGECTLHVRSCGGDSGIFLMLDRNTIFINAGPKFVELPSCYVNEFGESTWDSASNLPLRFSEERYASLERMYQSHEVAVVINRTYSSLDRRVPPNYF